MNEEQLKQDLINAPSLIRNDKHLNSVYDYLHDVLEKEGKEIVSNKVKGRSYSKNYDIVYKDKENFWSKLLKKDTRNVIELKSVSSHTIAKAINNRVEEMVGQAYLLKNTLNLESMSYVFIVNETKDKSKEKYITKLKKSAKILLDDNLLKNFVLIRVDQDGVHHDETYHIKDFTL